MKPLDFSTPPASVCVLRLSALGDVCHALPVVNTLRAAWPATRFSWIVGRTEASLIGDIPDIEFLSFDKAAGWPAYRELRRRLAGRRFDLLLHMQLSLRASLASRAVRAPLRLGFDRERAHDWQWLFTNRRIAHVAREHVMDSFFGFARACGVSERRLEWNIPVPPAAAARAREFIPDGMPALLVSPCANARFRNWRNWPYERYGPVADYAAGTLGWRVIVTGGPSAAEREAARAIVAASRTGIVNLQGKTSLKELLALIARAQVIITPDSGPAHMATAVGTPVIGLYATTNPERAGPYLSQ
ncbi:MAG TPA: glycosyltransferase family 9 protein, partial [Gammaproteobacteria bacterium]|nr:glycosyltransferase family 9 protein [Gammaproteobacteria bacterium]